MKRKLLEIGKKLIIIAGGIAGVLVYKKHTVDKALERAKKFKSYYGMLNVWLSLKQEEKTLVTWFEENGYKNIAIYGMGEIGNRLYEELRNTDINVAYAIDKNADAVYSPLSVYEKEDDLPEVDAIVVSVAFAFGEVSAELKKRCSCPVISLEDILYEM